MIPQEWVAEGIVEIPVPHIGEETVDVPAPRRIEEIPEPTKLVPQDQTVDVERTVAQSVGYALTSQSKLPTWTL